MTTEYASADDLLATDDLGDGEDLTLPSGKRVRLRGLSRGELIRNGRNGSAEAPAELIEARNVAACLIAPKMTVAQVQKWQSRSAAGGDFRVLSEAIRSLSGLAAGAQKSDVAEARD